MNTTHIVSNISYLKVSIHEQSEEEEEETPNVVYLEISFDNSGLPVVTGQLHGYINHISYCINEKADDNCSNIVSLAELYTECVKIYSDESKIFTITFPQNNVKNAVYYNENYSVCQIDINESESVEIKFTVDE